MDNLSADAPLSQWAQGFSIGYDYLEEVWTAYTPDEPDEEQVAVSAALTYVVEFNKRGCKELETFGVARCP